MNRRLNHHHQRRENDRSLFDDLARPLAAPDLTRSIMGRLGYMRVSPLIARRRRLQRWAGRVGVALVTFMSLGFALKMYESSPEVRRPVGPTIPAAIGHDLQWQQRRLGATIDTIRNLAPRPPQSVAPGPVGSDDAPPEINQDVDQSSIAAVRWV